MKSLFLLLALSAVNLAASPALSQQAEEGKRFSGEIVYKSGDRSSYNYFYSRLAGVKFPYSRDVQDMKGSTLSLPMIRFEAVARLDFIEPTSEERRLLETEGRLNRTRKTNVTFRNGQKLEGVFLDFSLTQWSGPTEEGNLDSPKIVAITVNVKGAS